LWRKILDAARDLFAAQGYERVSMRRAAEKIEYSPTTIYLYFKDKMDLLLTISDETLDSLVAGVEEHVSDIDDPVERSVSSGAHVRLGLERPHEYDLTFVMRPRYQGGLALPDGAATKRIFESVSALVRECVDHGVFRPVDPAAAAQAFWASCHGLTSLLIAYPDFPWVEQELLISRTLDTIAEGQRKRDSSGWVGASPLLPDCLTTFTKRAKETAQRYR